MEKDVFEKKIREGEISTEDILNEKFMKQYTKFNSYEDMEEEINKRTTKRTDMNKLLKIIFKEKTQFKDMEDMKKKAIEFYMLMN
ncbi:hypothetical protein C4N20_01835 [Fusobacterium ulcerans]|uniref:Uncharacterized protein n=1 Tax=Fusobacterium ulcerans TaxID=861 RepID=A0AAX2JF30_9FUSO|nr:hypothetical protein [Fusobacterium ulcerans]AVQ26875.1 hypothetical protein C4N20_01835 [Fusobacterium ulcerans]EFS25001.1 hypothetical protein FUAG_00516 [Fusobacterium ulcerans ATCC 49185]SQJ08801.1 Uncharacterised protein [Fusobacterium ulcerans]